MNLSNERVHRAYCGVPTFLRCDYSPALEELDADYAVIGVPYDDGSPFVGGSRFCARAVREHSMRFGGGALFDIENDREYLREALAEKRIVDVGDIDVVPSRGDLTMEKLTKSVAKIRAKGAMPIVLGGDHTLTFPVVRSFDTPIHVIQLDAHLDYSPVVSGMTYINSTSFRLLHDLDQVVGLTQIGIRSMRDSRQNALDARAAGSRIVTVPELRRIGRQAVLSHIPEGADCYLSIDIDAYDMSLVPGCVSAEPGGLVFDEMRALLEEIARRSNVVGFDFVEINPPLDVATGTTAYLGALTVAMCLGFIDHERRKGGTSSDELSRAPASR
ncbi:MAG: arginase family protein [Pseudomonadota bacterium]